MVRDSEHALVVRAAFHLIDLEVRQAASVAEAAAEVRADPPVLVVVEDELTRPDDLISPDVPVVRVADDAGPLQLLGAAQAAAPSLYECPVNGSVEPTPEDQLMLLTHDLRRAVEDERMRRAERDEARLATALGLVATLALRDIETSQHSYRVQWYARALALCVDPRILDDPNVELGFLLHDVGKLALPDRILLKPGALDEAELETMRTHPRLGAEIVRGILPAGGQAVAVVRSHHERWDGRGYPDGLRGEAIPLAARIFAVADTLDAISSDRPYRRARSWAEAVQTVRAESGAQFDPRVVAALDRADLDFLPRPSGRAPSRGSGSWLRYVCTVVALFVAATAAPTARASQLIDRNARDVQLATNRNGEALITYRVEGKLKHVLAWGAVNAIAPTRSRRQVAFKLDYSGGYGKYRRDYWKTFNNVCQSYDGPALAWPVTACRSTDGSYWALQSWQRGLPDYGVPPTREQAAWELRLSHWTGALPLLAVHTDWAYRRYDHLFGEFTYAGTAVFGFRSTATGQPLDTFGRNIYVDTFHSAYGHGWRRENSFLAHTGTGAFCYGLFEHSSGGRRLSGNGREYRATAIGPGVTPDVMWQGPAPGPYDSAADAQANEQIRSLRDGSCKAN